MKAPITQLLAAYREGDRAALGEMMPLVYDELRRIARAHLAREDADHTLQATALANEAWLKLEQAGDVDIRDRQHFLALASRQMRQVLVDHARRKFADKRGGRARPIRLDDIAPVALADNPAVLDLDRAIESLAALDERQARVVDLRFFGGFTVDEIAGALDCSASTVKREWTMARAWLRRELDGAA